MPSAIQKENNPEMDKKLALLHFAPFIINSFFSQ